MFPFTRASHFGYIVLTHSHIGSPDLRRFFLPREAMRTPCVDARPLLGKARQQRQHRVIGVTCDATVEAGTGRGGPPEKTDLSNNHGSGLGGFQRESSLPKPSGQLP